jgi:hypothetical protein
MQQTPKKGIISPNSGNVAELAIEPFMTALIGSKATLLAVFST